jgi:hypothetical protein
MPRRNVRSKASRANQRNVDGGFKGDIGVQFQGWCADPTCPCTTQGASFHCEMYQEHYDQDVADVERERRDDDNDDVEECLTRILDEVR